MNRRRALMVGSGGPILPAEFQQVAYIEGTGTQYINTGVLPSRNTRTDLTFIRKSGGWLFGAQGGGMFSCSIGTTTASVYIGSSSNPHQINSPAIDAEVKAYFEIIGGSTAKVMLGGQTGTWTVSYFSAPSYPLFVGGNNYRGNLDGSAIQIKLIRCKITKDGEIVRDMYPCYRKLDNIIGMYDTVGGQFYTNAGSGTFLKGADV